MSAEVIVQQLTQQVLPALVKKLNDSIETTKKLAEEVELIKAQMTTLLEKKPARSRSKKVEPPFNVVANDVPPQDVLPGVAPQGFGEVSIVQNAPEVPLVASNDSGDVPF